MMRCIFRIERKAGGKAIGTMLPYFITILLFAGAMGIGTDMVAGEKERGTMASLLVSPIKRKDIALGKVLALMLISGVSSLIYVAAMVIGAPLMMSKMGGLGDLDIQLSVQQILMLGTLFGSDCIPVFNDDCTNFCVCAVSEGGEYICDASLHAGIGNRTFDNVHVWRD